MRCATGVCKSVYFLRFFILLGYSAIKKQQNADGYCNFEKKLLPLFGKIF